ncbi:alanine dehydrogenase [Anaerovorax odorimutans]|uniref:alanine dehydrogenase n=1 Tax=Anaerovorax odorimutans TaxID=109327 RepID=A0ABT1RM86_9FIRM|nr:alanine dehydrogenase [Anaerovorax odorimutans]MCQ4636292.1 alanine dehydrogenase [Anaerovorax odorimutans]
MIIGIPKEKKDQEARVGLTPKWVKKLTGQGHTVYIEKGLALLAGIGDQEYIDAGAEILPTTQDIYLKSDMIVKLKDYMPSERDLPFKEGQIIVCFFHLGEVEPDQPMLDKLLASKVTGVSLELIRTDTGARPIIMPMSEIAGRVAVMCACHHCMLSAGGAGISLAAISGTRKPKILILGGGTCGYAAADVALGLHADVTVFESQYSRINQLQGLIPEAHLLLWSSDECAERLKDCDVLINTIYPYPGMEYPLVTREMVRTMKKNSLIVDLVGCDIIETVKYTTITDPTYVEEGVVHFGIDNLPALVPQTSSELFASSIYPYVEAIANKGIKKACEDSKELFRSMSFVGGTLVHKDIADTHNMDYTPFDTEML